MEREEEGDAEQDSDPADALNDVGNNSGMDVDVPEDELAVEGEEEEGDDDDDEEDPANVAMVPMADLLNARYGSENVRLISFMSGSVLTMCDG